MERVGGASAISEKDNLSASPQRCRALFGKLRDTGDQLGRKTLFYASALFELPSYFIGG
jgi:hypothetical protein